EWVPGDQKASGEKESFDKWTDGQRRRILVDLLERCSLSQQKFCAKQLQARVPTEAVDFTTRLPRVLSLYIFSFLDPRSLCRCAQVSWHWKHLSELDQLWMLKCLRFGWLLNFCPTPFEQGVWKKHYIQMVRELHLTRPKTPSKDEFIVIDVQPVKSNVPERKLSVAGLGTSRGKKELPPWRSPDRNPTDTVRYNYLDNQHPIEQIPLGRANKNLGNPQSHDKKAPGFCLNKYQTEPRLSLHPGTISSGIVWPSTLGDLSQTHRELPEQKPRMNHVLIRVPCSLDVALLQRASQFPPHPLSCGMFPNSNTAFWVVFFEVFKGIFSPDTSCCKQTWCCSPATLNGFV
uniref:Uncharacterized protein n=1 Tax=Geospiza parvula TaxID=87175 RepID=A0A8C3NIQ9_GEOPR